MINWGRGFAFAGIACGITIGTLLILCLLAYLMSMLIPILGGLVFTAWSSIAQNVSYRSFFWPARLAGYMLGWPINIGITCFNSTLRIFHSATGSNSANVFELRHFMGGFRVQRKNFKVIPLDENRLTPTENRLERVMQTSYRYNLPVVPTSTHNATIILIRSWLRECDRSHGHACQALADDSGYPMLLIDVKARCLVAYDETMKYLALSYVWGGTEDAQSLRSNIERLQQPNALFDCQSFAPLPRTILDAMYLTGWLGFNYLWCDRLCIVQDDPISKHSQIGDMAQIYARSICTIIAADNEHANSGLRGIPNLETGSRRKFGTSQTEVWPTRVWTFQEELFSSRRLWLSNEGVVWECRKSKETSEWLRKFQRQSVGEHRYLPSVFSNEKSMRIGGVSIPLETSEKFYAALVERYSPRRASPRHAADRFHAFTGIEKILRTRGPWVSGFVQCLPIQHFSSALIWAPSTADNIRAEISDPVTGRRAASWSWIGWQNPVVYSIPPYARELCNLVTWSVSKDRKGQKFTVADACREACADRQRNATSSIAEEDATSGISGLQVYSPEVQIANYLHGRTLTAQFAIDGRTCGKPSGILRCVSDQSFAGVLVGMHSRDTYDSTVDTIAISEGSFVVNSMARPIEFSLHGGAGRWRAVEPWTNDFFTDVEVATLSAEYTCRYEAILERFSCGCKQKRLNSLNLDGTYPVGSRYKYYNALCVAKRNGVVERKGLARIAKDVFDRECTGWVDVTLA